MNVSVRAANISSSTSNVCGPISLPSHQNISAAGIPSIIPTPPLGTCGTAKCSARLLYDGCLLADMRKFQLWYTLRPVFGTSSMSRPHLYTVSQHQLISPLGSTSVGTYRSTLLPANQAHQHHSRLTSDLLALASGCQEFCCQVSNSPPSGRNGKSPAKNLVVGAKLTPNLLSPAKQAWDQRSQRLRWTAARIEPHVFGEAVRRISLHPIPSNSSSYMVVLCGRSYHAIGQIS